MTDVNSSSNTSSLNYQRLHSNPVTPTTSTTNSTPTTTTDCDHHHTTTITTDSHHPLIATSPSNNSIALALTVDFELRESLALHRAVFERTPSKDLADMIDDWASRAPNKPMAEIVSVKDVHGNTPLHLAIMTGQKHTVQLLLSRDAPIKSRNAAGWTPLDEAISYGDRAMIRRILKSGRKQARRSMQSRRPKLIDALSRIPDFTMDLRWEFYSWVPIVKRFLPSDTCTLSKRGSSIRLDTTLVDFSDRSWQRGNITFIFNGEAKSDGRHGGKALTVLDNELKVYQSVKYSGHSSDIEEDIDILMSSDIIYPMMSTKSITFTRAQAGWWFSRYNRTEQVGQFEADFYNINGLVMESRKRREHLSEEDVQSNRQLIETLKRSMDNPKGGNGGNGGSGTSPSASTTELLDMAAMAGGAEEDEDEEEGELVNINGEKFPQKTPEKTTASKAQAAKQQQGTKKASTKKEGTKKPFNGSSVLASPPLSSEKKLPNGGAALTSSKTKKESGSFTEGSSAEDDEDDEDEDEDEDEYEDEDEFEEEAQSKQSKSKPSGRESRSSKNNSGGQTSEPSTPTSASIKALESTASHSFRRRRSLPPPAPPSTPITWQAYIRAPRGHPPCLARPLKSKTSTRTFKATLAMSRDFPLSIESLLNVLEVVAPFKHFKKLNEFVRLNLPPGFPVKIDIPVIPAVLARVTFLNFTFKTDIPEALFEVPADYTEDPSRFPDI